MFHPGTAPTHFLDVPTLAFVSIALAGLLGLFLLLCWVQERDLRPLAWWGSAYLIGAASVALWVTPGQRIYLPPEVPEALTLFACGIVWSGIRLFHGRTLRPIAAFAGAILWPVICLLPGVTVGTPTRIGLGALMVASYTFIIAWELWRERRKTLFSRTAAIVVPCLHAAIFLMPLVMQRVMPTALGSNWMTVLALESIIYGVGTAFIVLLLVKDHHVHIYRRAATTDHLTGLPNRRAFLEGSLDLCARLGRKRESVTLMMFDLDHFKSINDHFGHAIGDEALKVFAQVMTTSMRATDVLGRLGGEEFAAIVPGDIEVAVKIAERIRSGFEEAGRVIAGHAIDSTVSIGAACATAPVAELDALLNRADAALYDAKRGGRNRVCVAPDAPAMPDSAEPTVFPPPIRKPAARQSASATASSA